MQEHSVAMIVAVAVASIVVLTIVVAVVVVATDSAASAASAASRSTPSTSSSPPRSDDTIIDVAIEFVSAADMEGHLRMDATSWAFFDDMTDADVCANDRTISVVQRATATDVHPADRYVTSIVDPHAIDRAVRRRIRQAVAMATVIARPLAPVLSGVRWRMAVLRKDGFGAQYPHTLGDIVCMPVGMFASDDEDKIRRVSRTLVHERIHILQRLAPAQTHRLIVDGWGMRRVCLRKDAVTDADMRSNPDLDGWLYTHQTMPVVTTVQVYTSAHPSDLSASVCRRFIVTPSLRLRALNDDVRALSDDIDENPPDYEHPYERMAYELEALLLGGARAPNPRAFSGTASDTIILSSWLSKLHDGIHG